MMTDPMRINIVGVSGSGKSTFGKRLSLLWNVPMIEMDALYWKPDWTEPTDEEFSGKLARVLDGEAWILDGNYSRTTSIKWARVQMVIWLDYSFPRTLWQSVRRTWRRALSKEELWPGTGNRESFLKSFFSRQSVIWWSITSRSRARRRYLEAMHDPTYSHIKFVRLTSHAETERYYMSLASKGSEVSATDS